MFQADSFDRKLNRWGPVLLIVGLVLVFPPTPAAQEAKVSAVREQGVDISIGAAAGVEPNMTGFIYYEELFRGEMEKTVVAKFEIVRVGREVSEARLTQKGEELVQPGYLVHFDQPLIAPPKPGRLTVQSIPDRASIFIEGVFKGRTPRTLSLDPGIYTLRVTAPGHRDETIRVEVKPNESSIRVSQLQALPPPEYELSLDSNPQNAGVWINGEPQGITPLKLVLVRGPYVIKLEKPGFHSVDESLDLNEPTSRLFSLEEIGFGTLVLSAHPPADVEIDGEPRGETPPRIEISLPEGRHSVRFLWKKSAKEAVEEVFIVKNEKKVVHKILQ